MNEWLLFFQRAFRCTIRLFKNVKLFFYFLITICAFGAIGVWIPFFQKLGGSGNITDLMIYRNLATYFVAISITSLADCIISKSTEDEGAFRIFLLAITFCVAVFAIIIFIESDPNKLNKFVFWGSVGAAWVWLMVHDNHPELTKTSPYSPIGGEIS
jgi:peptidoglycan/LPS O-acetylase OafA/YrhL